jgi:ribosomal protein S26
MTPKEKAIELLNKFSAVGLQIRNEGSQCAIIAVDEIAKSLVYCVECTIEQTRETQYWNEVKIELEKL